MPELVVLEPGVFTTIQDRGRPGFAAVGVTSSGAFDSAAYEWGAQLLGNRPGAAALEVLVGGLAVTATSAVRAVLTGGVAPATCRGRQITHGEPFFLVPGAELRLGYCTQGARVYLSIAGGIEAPETLGSVATDTLSGLGPAPLRTGDRLTLGRSPMPARHSAVPAPTLEAGLVTLDVMPGPRADWLLEPLAGEWTVAQDSNRVGVRLDGRQLNRAAGELPSEGVVRGAIQLPPHGRPVIFGPDHPTTGGYPVVGVLTSAANDRLAQLQPGQSVRLRPTNHW